MKKVLLVLIPSLLLISCGNNEIPVNNEIVTTESSSPTSTTTTTLPILPEEEVHGDPPPTTAPRIQASKPATPQPAVAGAIGRISIPSIGVDWPIYEGIALSVLNKGPGHYPHSPKPCRAGNAAIAGHRTTYGAPFNKLNLLKEGDIINVTTPEGDCTYKYLRTEIVSPTNVSIVMPKGGNFLTLTACHPKGSAAQRITVTATLENVIVK